MKKIDINSQVFDEVNVYETKDFHISAFLLTKGIKMKTYRRGEPRLKKTQEITFIFPDNKKCEELITHYLLHDEKSLVDPIDYDNAKKNLKDIVFSG